MSQDPLKDFLKRNYIETPKALPDEAFRIWNKISETEEHRGWRSWLWIPTISTAALVGFMLVTRSVSERVLTTGPVVEEQYLHQEWNDLMQDTDVDAEIISLFGK